MFEDMLKKLLTKPKRSHLKPKEKEEKNNLCECVFERERELVPQSQRFE
jgi:hypothetical protein